MLKFIKGHMASIDGIEIYPIISLLIFFLFFSLVIWFQFRADKTVYSEVENYPLDAHDLNTKDHG
jgi:cbb3-type cytochrome oxidase subunit 3